MRWAIKHKSGRTLFITSDKFIANNRRRMGWIVEKVEMTSREQFEKWFSENFDRPYYSDEERDELEVYTFLAWRASRAAIEIELPEPCSPGDFCVDIPAQAHHEVVEAIEQAGLKVKQ